MLTWNADTCHIGFVLYMISRECIYYVNLRQAYLLSPAQSQRLSSRTVLFTCVPRNLLDPAKVRKLFGDSVRNVWVPRNTKGLKKLVDERDETALRLEGAEIVLIKKANAVRRRQLGLSGRAASVTASEAPEPTSKGKSSDEVRVLEKSYLSLAQASAGQQQHHHDDEHINDEDEAEYVHPYGLDPSLPDLRGSVAAQYIPAESRPHHRPLANFGRRVDTIRWTRLRLKTLNEQIAKLRRQFRNATSFGRGRGATDQRAFCRIRLPGICRDGVSDNSSPPALAHVPGLHRHSSGPCRLVVAQDGMVGTDCPAVPRHGGDRGGSHLLVDPVRHGGACVKG